MQQIKQNLELIQNEISKLNQQTKLIAVSKTFPESDIIYAYNAGMRRFGENYPQELANKVDKLINYHDIEWHFIGNIQSNKTRLIAENASYVHTLAKKQHAKRLNDQRPKHLPKLKVMIEVNISNEENKHGVRSDISEIHDLATFIQTLPNLELCGLMGMASDTKNQTLIKSQFMRLRTYQDQLNEQGFTIKELSIGMSNDYEVAIECGATMVRIGSKIFGVRNYDNN